MSIVHSSNDVNSKINSLKALHIPEFDYAKGGLPVWDVGWSYEIYQNALKLGLGQILKLWDEPYLN